MTGALRSLLAHPATRGLDLDDPATTVRRRDIILAKPFLREIYRDWYTRVAAALPRGDGAVLELGSGAGFFAEVVPAAITSDVVHCPFVNVVLDGRALPFRRESLRAVVMTNVLHHIPEPGRFLDEVAGAVREGGVIAMVEPWLSRWSRFVYRRLHHENFDPQGDFDGFAGAGPLSNANGALPWILFERDRERFSAQRPEWRIETVEPMMPFRYLVSGGVSMRTLMPGWATAGWRAIESALAPRMSSWAMFALIVLRRTAYHRDSSH